MKVIVSNLSTRKSTPLNLDFRPSIGDILPIQYLNEKVVQVYIVTDLLKGNQPSVVGYDLLVFTE